MSTQIKIFVASFSILILIFIFTDSVKSAPNFKEAVMYCDDVSNDLWVEEERTFQDKCIDDFMAGNIGSSVLEIFYFIDWRNT